MGDRCYLSCTFRKSDWDANPDLHEYFGSDVQVDGNSVTATAEEANYASASELDEWAEKGIVFEGWHGTGGDYTSGVFASDGKVYRETWTIEGQPAARLQDDGTPEPGDAEAAKEYREVLKAAIALMASPKPE